MMVAAASADATDEQLVAASRMGSDRAFEVLFRRYRDRIKMHVSGMLTDEARAEDVTQEAFISALRSLRATDQKIAFKPWIYQIARNACIDHIRRLRRADEVSIDSEDFKPNYEGRLSQSVSGTESTVSQREDLDNLRQAFRGLPDSQHRILVMRELEGLSYEQIGRRMNLSAGAVESMLFRARRGLKGEYRDISTGERCRRMHLVIAEVAEGVGGRRDRRMLVRHLRECPGCRREAAVMGIGPLAADAARRGRARAAVSRVAGLLPIPAFLRRRRGSSTQVTDGGTVVGYARRLYEMGPIGSAGAEQAATAFQKAVAVIVAVAVVGGGGIVAQKSGTGDSALGLAGSGAGATGGGGLAPPGSAGWLGLPPAGGGHIGGGGPGSSSGGLGGGGFGAPPSGGGGQGNASSGSPSLGSGPAGSPLLRSLPGDPSSPSLPKLSAPGSSVGTRDVLGGGDTPGALKDPTSIAPKLSKPSLGDSTPSVSAPSVGDTTPSVKVPTPSLPKPSSVGVPSPSVSTPQPSTSVPPAPSLPQAPSTSGTTDPLRSTVDGALNTAPSLPAPDVGTTIGTTLP